MARNLDSATIPLGSGDALTTLALDAAIDLERLILDPKGRSETKSIAALAKVLDAVTQMASDPEGAVGIANAASLEIYNRALQSTGSVSLASISELICAIQRLTQRFQQIKTDEDVEDLKRLQDFCLALHRELLSETVSEDTEYSPDIEEEGSAVGLR